jgi:hypothetical protein
MAPAPFIVLAGATIGALTGLFGVRGSSVAGSLLSLLGVPGLVAVASPLPATIPVAAMAANTTTGAPLSVPSPPSTRSPTASSTRRPST